jgi:hypothetical protein
VSVIIPAHNAADTVTAALASIATQTRRPDAVVVVDDGSTDGTDERVAAWQHLLPLQVVRLTENRGLAMARNIAIEANDVPLLALLDADDVWLPDHLDLMYRTYQSHGGVVTADAHRWIPGVGVEAVSYRRLRPIPSPDQQRIRILDHDFVFIGTLFARSDFVRVGGFRTGVREDWDLWIRMARDGVKITGAPHPTVLYRLRARGMSLGSDTMKPEEICTVELAAVEAPTERERRAATRTVRRLRSARHLVLAYEAADAGQISKARHEARQALVAQPRAAAKAMVMLTAPRAALKLRELIARPVDRWIRRHMRPAADASIERGSGPA